MPVAAVLVAPNFTGTKTLTYRTALTDTSNSSSYTFSGVSIGTAAGDRRAHVAVHLNNNSGTVTVTVGGVSATINASVTGGGVVSTRLFTAWVPTGTTADVVVSTTSAQGCHVGVWTSVGLATNEAYRTDTSTADPGTATLNTLNNGFCIAAGCNASAVTVTWTNATERYDQTDAESFSSSGASAATTGADISPSGDYSAAGTTRAAVFATF